MKWTKVTTNYLEKYQNLIHLFFDYVRDGRIRFRVMLRETHSSSADKNWDKYFKLYCQFLKHSFGLRTVSTDCNVRIYLDELPDTHEKRDRFKRFLRDMPDTHDFQESHIHIREEDIAEVRSHDHVILQCVDIILGAMQFRMNDMHLEKPEGSKNRGRRTIRQREAVSIYKS